MPTSASFSAAPCWEVLPSKMPSSRSAAFAANLSTRNNAIVVVMNRSCFVFDTHAQKWAKLPSLSTSGSNSGVVCDKNTIFLMNTHGNSTTIHPIAFHREGNNQNEEWERLPPTTTRRFGCGIVAVEGNIVVVGGHCQSYLQSTDIFNVRSRTWTCLPNMLERRFRCATAAIGSKVYVFGGTSTGSTVLNTAEYFQIGSNTWEKLPMMPRYRAWSVAAVADPYIFLIGGMDELGNALNAVDCFDTATQQWVQDALPPLNNARYSCGAASVKGQVYVFGGHSLIEHEITSRSMHIDTVERIRIDPYYLIVPKLLLLFQKGDLPLGLWPHIISKCPSNVVHHILLSERFQLDSVLLYRSDEKEGVKKSNGMASNKSRA